jgi:hypothetical protein
MVYQRVPVPAAVMACRSTSIELSPGVSAFHDAISLTAGMPGSTHSDVQVPVMLSPVRLAAGSNRCRFALTGVVIDTASRATSRRRIRQYSR